MHLRIFASIAIIILIVVSSSASADEPLPPKVAPGRMTLPEGFQATLFVGEPDVVQPIAFTFDDRGRLWVVECLSYPKWTTAKEGTDRVLIFEDTKGDGHFDKRTVFYDKGANLSGIAVGFGGVWLCSSPNLIFIPDREGRDKPDGPPVVVLDGWNLKEAGHNIFSNLCWGPDGWLYGCNGIQSNSRVGKPGTPDAERVFLNCGVWRYHPTKGTFEAVAHGTTNPWGLDFDDYGQAFITNCVIKHLWHVVPGAHFQRMYGEDANPYFYGLLESCADHIHWGGGKWTDSRITTPTNDAAGGGHAHVGAMIYLGNNFPESYRNGLFTCNMHGNRVNHDSLERLGSAYVAHHAKDFLLANDPWFRGLSIQYGPDGGVFVSDWTDTGECHNHVLVDQTNGRIYKVVYGNPAPWHGDLAKLSDHELVGLQLHHNDWFVRHARLILQERAAAGKLEKEVPLELRKMLQEQPDATRKLRALWALHVIGAANQELLTTLLDDPSEYLRGWAIRLLVEDRQPADATLSKFANMAARDPSAWVRLALASALQRTPAAGRWSIAEALIAHEEDNADAYLPLMDWYGIEPLVAADPVRFLGLIAHAKMPLVREYIARRLASDAAGLRSVVQQLGKSGTQAQLEILRGIQQATLGRSQVKMPDGWPEIYRTLAQSADAGVREKALFLAVLFNDQEVVKSLRALLADRSAATAARLNAMQTLAYRKDPALVPVLQGLLEEKPIRLAALRLLASYSDGATPHLILDQYAACTEEEKAAAISTLASRTSYALALLDAVEKGQVPRTDVSVFTVRQMQALKDRSLSERVTKVWGAVRSPAAAARQQMAKYQAELTPTVLKNADRSKGRQVFQQTCATCHVLFGEGSKIGPDLTGSQRTNLDYLLENILDPSAIVPVEYQVTVLALKDGRVITGLVKSDAGLVLMVQTEKELLRIPVADVDTRQKTKQSMMPDGLLTKLKDDEIRNLIGYLISPEQVPLPAKSSQQ
ncbi:MAG TPA: PVC-type heme-binding CxxCH protein [Gemmataceae bacterium]|jgi:putative membrane-bound dehydrogenase-like protein|nr:PVC-type heme-binding CxxCH protein [Gemmataceae bacterium]